MNPLQTMVVVAALLACPTEELRVSEQLSPKDLNPTSYAAGAISCQGQNARMPTLPEVREVISGVELNQHQGESFMVWYAADDRGHSLKGPYEFVIYTDVPHLRVSSLGEESDPQVQHYTLCVRDVEDGLEHFWIRYDS